MALRRGDKGWDGVERRDAATILVVNDEEDAAALLDKVLLRAGYRVADARTHEDALTTATELLPRAVLLDLTHGGIGSNLKLLEAIRHHGDERVATTRVLLLARQAANRVFSFQSGTDAFLTRPFHVDALLEQIGKLLAIPFRDLPQHRRQMLEGY